MPTAALTAADLAKKKLDEKKKGKFLSGLKDWVMSPGGVVTLVLIVGLFLWIEHKTKDK